MNYLVLVVTSLLAAAPLYAEEDSTQPLKTVSEIAAKVARAPGAPRYSDVSFSPRWRRPKEADDPHDTFRDATSFHATRFDWVYSHDPEWIAECRERGYWFTGALNSKMNDVPGVEGREKGRILNQKGERVAAPWMRGWAVPGYWGCINSPEFRDIYLTRAKLLVDGGVSAIQQDDPGMNYTATTWGGCHCEHCQARAEAKGIDLGTDMKAFQKDSIMEFYATMRGQVDRYAGRRIPWSSNNYDGRMDFPYDLFDYGTAELPHRSAIPEQLYQKITKASRLGRQQIYTYVSTDVPHTRRVIAFAYACGGHIIVPYDIWHGNRPRIFGKPEEYADLYGFVRAVARYLDGFEDAAALGKGIHDSRYGETPPIQADVEDVYAFVRAQPGDGDAPVVVHLIDWRKEPQPFTVTLQNDRFYPDSKLTAKLLMPPAYDKEMHTGASETKDYALLAAERKVEVSEAADQTEITVPKLSPWGVLVLMSEEPNQDATPRDAGNTVGAKPVEVARVDIHDRLYPDRWPQAVEPGAIRIPRGAPATCQFAVRTDSNGTAQLSVQGNLPGKVRIYWLQSVHVEGNTQGSLKNRPGGGVPEGWVEHLVRAAPFDTLEVLVGNGEMTLSSMFRIRHGRSTPIPRFKGRAKSPQWSYPYGYEHDGKLYVVYSIGKEDCGLSVIPIESLATSQAAPKSEYQPGGQQWKQPI